MIPKTLIDQDIDSWLREDIPFFDLTSSVLLDSKVTAWIYAKKEGIIAGVEVAAQVFEKCGTQTTILQEDGSRVKPQTKVLEIQGTSSQMLQAERVALNILSHMSGIATKTRELVDLLRNNSIDVRVAATRKTLPGLRKYQKWAVIIGGGDSHRMSLSDMVLIKENHISSAPSMKELIQNMQRSISFSKKIEVEVVNIEQAIAATELGVDIIMLDNFQPKDIPPVVKEIKKINPKILIEVSGNITEDNILEYASTGIDIISLGKLTHSSTALDLSMLVEDN